MSLTLEPLVIRRTGFSPVIRYSCLHSHSHTIHQHSHAGFTSCTTLPYPTTLACGSHSFGGVLEPRYIVGAESLDQWAVTHSFKGGCFSANLLVVSATPHPFPLSTRLGALTDDLGCFPLDDEAYPPPSHCSAELGGIRSLADVSNLVGPISQPVALPPPSTTERCT